MVALGSQRLRPGCGAHDWNRTSDLFLTKEVLYRLSYVSLQTKRRDRTVNGAGDGNRTRTNGSEGRGPTPARRGTHCILVLTCASNPTGQSACPGRRRNTTFHLPGIGRTGSRRARYLQLPGPGAWWREVDSNHRRRKPADLQSAPVGRLGIPPETSPIFWRQARPPSIASRPPPQTLKRKCSTSPSRTT